MSGGTAIQGGESEQVFTTSQVAGSLKLGPAMIRKYALALEAATGEKIPLKGREGRQFSPANFEVISKAKALVDAENGLSINTALKMVLSGPESAADSLAMPKLSGNTLELADALTAAMEKGNEPLLAELRELRKELREGRQVEVPQQMAQVAYDKQHSLLVRLALRVEKFLKR
jgi:hypothetical protein